MDEFNLLRSLSTRRNFLIGAGTLTGLAIAGGWSDRVVAQPKFSAYPFSLGVASGEPLPDSVVIWTRLAPNPLTGTELPAVNIPVEWQVATDAKMGKVIAKGTTLATPELGHSVHVVVQRLEPDRYYWYQFKTGGEISPVGRTRTMPGLKMNSDRLAFAFVSCQNYEHGYFSAYQHLAQEDLHFVLHLGDYIYEGKGRPKAIRPHQGPNPVDLATYRQRYALYKSDPNLQAAHAAFPFICAWDDHEVENDYANAEGQNFQDPEKFLQQRAAAYQAYYEHLPLRPISIPQGANLRLYRRLAFGNLAEFSILDGRQYRDDQPCDQNGKGGGQVISGSCQERLDPKRTMLGVEQERWLLDGLGNSKSRWTVITQPTLMATLDQLPGEPEAYWSDGWEGYVANRQRILDVFAQKRPSNPIVLGGDIHSFWVTDLKPDFRDPKSPVVATEFVGTSISSRGPSYEIFSRFLPDNPHIKFFETRLRGYVKCIVTPEQWISQLQVVNTVEKPDSTIRTLATYRVENGRPGAQQV
jgi:alkaline phosphatase D